MLGEFGFGVVACCGFGLRVSAFRMKGKLRITGFFGLGGVGFTNLYKLSLALSLSLSLFLCLYCTATYVVTIAVHVIWSFRCEGFAFQESVIMSGTTIGLGFGVLGYRASKGFNRRTPANPKLNPPPSAAKGLLQ